MKKWGMRAALALIAIVPAMAQNPEPAAKAMAAAEAAAVAQSADTVVAQAKAALSNLDMDRVQADVERAQIELMKADRGGFNLNLDLNLAGVKEQLAFLQVGRGVGAGVGKGIGRNSGYDSGQYDSGTRLLDERKYDEAIQRFDRVIADKGDRADGALYWKAYALNRIGRRDEAMGAIAALRRDYPSSRWLNDAQALEVEVKQNTGQAISPADDSNDDIKLMAINSLMNADPDRAMPLLEGLLKSSASPRVKERALFVLTQNRSARAQQILTDYAKGAGNPDLQIRAIRYIGMSGTPEAQQQLVSVYSASNDAAVKREIIRSLQVSKGRDPLFNLAKSEKDVSLRTEAIRQLGAMKAVDQLNQLYSAEPSSELKVQIIRSLMAAGAQDKLLDIAKNEKDPEVRKEAVRNLAYTRSATPEMLTGLYATDTDPKTKREIVNALFSRGDAKAMVDMARKETDPAMKKYIVQQLSVMHNNKEATDYMLELLK